MEEPISRAKHDLDVASRKAEEAALRRYQATHWLDCLVGPLGISSQPSEREFISCLRNGLILCQIINKIEPGSVPKIVKIHTPMRSLTWDSRPLPAYQYFENVRNFLVAVEELKLPAFEASDLQTDNLEVGSSAKVVDCILALKSYHEWKQIPGGIGSHKPPRSPLAMNSVGKQLDMTTGRDKRIPTKSESQKFEDSVVRALADSMVDTKENIDENIVTSYQIGNTDPVKLLSKILSHCLEEQLQNKCTKLKVLSEGHLRDGSSLLNHSTSTVLENLSNIGSHKCCKVCLAKGNCKHWQLFQVQEKELSNLKVLWSRTKQEFEDLQSHLHTDLRQIGSQVQELSIAALGYHKVMKENRDLYNMVQDLKGNIRVYCRIRPTINATAKSVVDYIGNDGSLVVADPSKPQKNGRKVFQFNRVFGPTAAQDEVFRDIQPLVRSVMDGYNVCIFAYGQTGSGKTHTMCGPSGGSSKELGINYLALSDLFQLSNRRKDIVKYDIYVQMVEIYNEQIRDLLADDTSATKLEVPSCITDGGLNLPDATMRLVMSTTDVLNLMKIGETNRAVTSTALNDRSSRSHSILTVHVHGKDESGSVLRSCLHLVDLAGSERVDKSEVSGDELKEAQHINKSLSCLGDVITALAQKSSYIPYRNSKLTLLLQNSLGGQAKTLMFTHISPEGDSFGETISTLKFSQRVSTVELCAAHLNKESGEVLELKDQIQALKRALANKETQTNQIVKPKQTERTPVQKSKATERTPPCSRRLSIENGSALKVEKAGHDEDKKGPRTPVQTRSRRLSLEGPRYANKEPVQIKVLDTVSRPVESETACVQKSGHPQDVEAITKPYGHIINGGSVVDVYHQRAPRSPTAYAYQNRASKTDSRARIVSLQQPKTPEPPVVLGNEVQMGMQSKQNLSLELQTPTLNNSTNGKGSHIRKSLRNFRKLINGSEKRNEQKSAEVPSPCNETSSIKDAKSPIPSTVSKPRRQSLAGIQQSERSRRSSLGGNSAEFSDLDATRNAKTPPPVRTSAKVTKRWH